MKKRFLAAIAVIAASAVIFAGCNSIRNAVAQIVEGNIIGEVGKTYATQWFEFTVEYIEVVPSYAGYTAAPGHKLVDVLITEKGTFSEPSPMGTFDFRIDHDTFVNWYWPLDPLDDTMMPEEFDLAKGQEVSYHMVYEVPDDVKGLKLVYIELNTQDEEGNTFTINIDD